MFKLKKRSDVNIFIFDRRMDLKRSHSKRLENIVEQSSSEVIIVVLRPKTFS